jgi:hypothetical protein
VVIGALKKRGWSAGNSELSIASTPQCLLPLAVEEPQPAQVADSVLGSLCRDGQPVSQN